MRFTWDRAKAVRNERVHGVSFETAVEVFEDPNHVVGENYFVESAGEQRYQVIGITQKTDSAPRGVRRPQPTGWGNRSPHLGSKGSEL